MCLSPGGLFAFTVETHDGDGVELGEKLRYRHGAAHVRTAVSSAPLQLLELAPVATRIESGGIVPGLLAVAMRSTLHAGPAMGEDDGRIASAGGGVRR